MPRGDRHAFMPVPSGAEHPTLESIHRLTHEYELKDHLDAAWALRPVELVRERGRTMLVVDFAGGEPLDRLIRQPMEIGRFLRTGSRPVRRTRPAPRTRAHPQGHQACQRDRGCPQPGTVWLTGFGIASRLPRERQSPEPPEFIAGTLAYMAPEQTGRVNRSIDSRSDLYSLGVTFYEMLTGSLPFTASDPMEWVHCHIARQPARTQRATEEHPGRRLRDHDEAALQDRRGAIPDGGGCRERPAALPRPNGSRTGASTTSRRAIMTLRIAS